MTRETLPSFFGRMLFYDNHQLTAAYDYADDISVWTNCSAVGESNNSITVDSSDVMDTIAIRSTDVRPKNYNVYTTAATDIASSNYVITTSLRYFDNNQVVSTKIYFNESNYYPWTGYGVVHEIDKNDETIWGILFVTRSSSAVSYMRIFRWNQLTDAFTTVNIYSVGSSTINCGVLILVPNINQGCWLYFKTTSNGINGAGYYLIYFNDSLSRTFTLREAQQDFVGGMCLANSNSHLWYANKYLNTVLKINTSGTTLASYDATDSISIVHPDGLNGCYVLQGEAILRLNSSAQFLYTVPVGPYVSNFCIDRDTGGFWLLYQSSQIINITNDGVVNFSSPYTSEHFVTDLKSVHGGVWFKCVNDKKWRFFDSTQKKVTKEIYTPTSGGVDLEGFTNTPLFFSKQFNEEDFDSRFPLSIDTYWQDLSWRKVSPRNYLLPQAIYHQVKFTLRVSNPGKISPILKSLYRYPILKLENIPPSQTKNIYVKANISSLNETQLGHYTSNLKVWWYIPE
jgi:hypothetical protein